MKYQSKLETTQITFPSDKVVIVKYVAGLPGGRTLDLTNFVGDYVPCGTPVKLNSAGDCVPVEWDATNSQYKTLSSGEVYVGMTANTISVKDPAVSIMTMGVYNDKAIERALPAAFHTAFPAITKSHDTIA